MGFAQFKGGGISSPFEDPPAASAGRGPRAVQNGDGRRAPACPPYSWGRRGVGGVRSEGDEIGGSEDVLR